MTLTTLPTGIVPEDYERIEAAVMETARGRWFLLEFARRGQDVLGEIARIKNRDLRVRRHFAEIAAAVRAALMDVAGGR